MHDETMRFFPVLCIMETEKDEKRPASAENRGRVWGGGISCGHCRAWRGTLAPAKQGNGKGTARIAAEVLALTEGAHQARYGEWLEIRCTTAAV